MVYQERGELKGNKVSEDPWDQLGLQEEPLENRDHRDLRGLLESLESQEFLVFLDERGNWGRLDDQERRRGRVVEKKVFLMNYD